MAHINYGTPRTGASPAWVGDELAQREAVVVSGALLHKADFPPNADGGSRRFVESGTLIGRTFAEREAGRGFGPVALDAGNNVTDNEVFLVINDVYDVDDDNQATLYRNRRMVHERFLPAASKTAPMLAAIRARYDTRRGEA